MTAIAPPDIHDSRTLATARALLDAAADPQQMQREVLAAVARNEQWRGNECINLLAPEALMSPTVRQLLSAEVGQRAAEGHIGPVNRWFAGTKHIDEIEALCVELLKRLFKANYAEHRLVASMIGNMAVYAALTEPGDTVMTIPQPVGGHSSNRHDGPAGIRGLNIVDVPFNAEELEVDLDAFASDGREHEPKLIALGASMTLFPLPVQRDRRDRRRVGRQGLLRRRAPARPDRRRPVPGPARRGRRGDDRQRRQDVLRPAVGRDGLERPGAHAAAARRRLPRARRHPPGQPRRRARRRGGRAARVRPGVHGRRRHQRPDARARAAHPRRARARRRTRATRARTR